MLWVGPTVDAGSRRRGRGTPRRRARRQRPRGFLVLRKVAATPPGFPRRAGGRPQAPPGVAAASAAARTLASCPGPSTRSRTRRAASARRRRPSTSPPASRRPASGRSSSISTPRRTRPRASASAANGHSTLRPARRRPARPPRPRHPVPEPRPRAVDGRSWPARRSSSRARGDGERVPRARRSRARATLRYVFLDCPPSLGPLTVNALAAADRVLVPVQAEYYALEGLSQMLSSLDLVRAAAQPAPALGGILLTMVDGRTRLAAEVERRGATALRRAGLPARVPRSVRLAEAPSHGLPVIAYDRRSRGADAYWRVARSWSSVASPAAARRGLGRGLEVLVGGAADEPELAQLPVELIRPNPRQPRRTLRRRGGLGPDGVGARRGRLAARRRTTASGRDATSSSPASAVGALRARPGTARCRRSSARRMTGTRSLLALVENVAREELSAIEEARAYAVLVDEFGLALGEIASRVGRSKPSVSNRLRLLELPDDVLELVEPGRAGRGPRPCAARGPGPRPAAPLRPASRAGGPVGAHRRTARAQRRRAAPPAPRLVRRSTRRSPSAAAKPPNGSSAARPVSRRAGSSSLHDEHDLAELAEALERAREVGDPGFEPGTSALSERRSNQLS